MITAIVVVVCVGVILVIIWVVNRRFRIFGSNSGQSIVLLPLINQGEVPTPLETPLPIAAPTFFGTEEAPELPSPTVSLPSPEPASPTAVTSFAFTPTFSISPTALQHNSTQTPTPRATSTKKPTSTSGAQPTQGTTSQASSTPTTPSTAGVTFRNDKGCLDTETSILYIFGEIVNNTSQAYDIMDIGVHVFDASGEVPVTNVAYDMPDSFFVFSNSAIPFVLNAILDRPQFTRYELSIETQPGDHTARTDLRVFDYTIEPDQDSTKISGKWSYSNLANPPDFVAIVGTAYDTQGRVVNMDYEYNNNPSEADPLLPAGQHTFENLFLQNSPCGQGNIQVSIIGE